jgi:serine/threonine-protein kinase
MPAFSSTDELTVFSSALSGQYEVEREIGRGGMGVVYLARDLRLDRMVAIKTLPPAMGGDPVFRERFLREARTAARLNHPNIVPIHRADEAGGQVFFVMGFVDGDSLAGRLAAGPLSPRDALPILRDVAQALGYAHAHGVIHRDVKTENILLDAVTGRAMVTDFGIARVAAAAPLTATGQVLGTVYYLSPEQVAGENVDARSDIYALGVVGFTMLSGRFPFDGNLASAVLIAHVVKPAPKLASVVPTVPASVAAIIDRCLAKNPAERFQTCADLDAALELVRADASAVTVAPPRSPSPLISNTEAQAILGRAAELSDRPNSLFVPAAPRDLKADAERREGFKTSVLRAAADEAGIEPKYVEQALAERGLRGRTERGGDRRAANLPFDLTRRPRGFVGGSPTEIIYEMVVNGEVAPDDYDVMVSAINHYTELDGMGGTPASVGRTLTWNGRTGGNRELRVSIMPRDGRTTLRVMENLKRTVGMIHGMLLGGVGGGGGALTFAWSAGHKHWGVGLTSWALVFTLSYLIARTATDEFSKKRQSKALSLLESLAAQARELAKPKK